MAVLEAKDLVELGKTAQEMKDSTGNSWADIATELGISGGKVALAVNYAKVRPKDRIKDITPKQVVELRDKEKLSWGIISARTAVPESRLRSMYETQTGRSTKGNRIGKGGRFPMSENGSAPAATKKTAPAKKAPATKKVAKETKPAKSTKKAPAKKEAAASGSPKGARGTLKLSDLDSVESATSVLEGKKIVRVAATTGKEEIIPVKTVKSLDGDELVFFDGAKTRTVRLSAIKKVSR